MNLPANRPGTLPAGGNRPGIADRPAAGNRPVVGNRPVAGNNIGNRTNVNVNRTQINRQINNRYPVAANRPFTRTWWGAHPGTLPAYRWHPWYRGPGRYPHGYWWRRTTAVALTGFVAYAWTRPLYYGYGSGGNVYYEGDTVYVDNQPYASATEYYDQAASIATDVPEMTDEQAEAVEWMPLGVFALTQEGVNDSNLLLQLAVSKEGIIAGSLYNETTETTREVEGSVDKETQRAAWSLVEGENSDVVMETGIYDLTQDECTALVHFGPEKSQAWVMVRLDEPKEEQ